MIRASALLLILALAACSSTSPEDSSTLDGLTEQFARATAEVPSFGGLTFDGNAPVVFTLGDEPAAKPIVQEIFNADVAVQARLPVGRGSEALKDLASRLLLGKVRDVQSADYDETTGYVRIGVVTAEAVREGYRVLEDAEYPTEEVIVEVEGRISIML